MPMFVTLYRFTDQGIRTVKDSPKRLETAIKAGQAAGLKVLSAYYTLGEYDLVIASEAADETAGFAHTLAVSALGNVRSTTMRAFSPKEFSEIVKKIP